MHEIKYQPIGYVRSMFNRPEGTPIQPAASLGDEAYIELLPEFTEGLADLDEFSHIFVIFHMHLITQHNLKVIPFLDNQPRGVFATRSPGRPNPVGISVVQLVCIAGNKVHILNHDLLDGSPVIDIKPYLPQFDVFTVQKTGWFNAKLHEMFNRKDDGRFT